MLYGLAIHTGSPELGLAIDNFAGERRAQTWNLGRDSSNYLHDRLAEFILPQTWPEIGFIAVAIGPGSFTGTRLGVVLARTLAQQLEIPLFGLSNLMAIAAAHTLDHRSEHSSLEHSSLEHPPAATIAIQMPAQRGQLYGAIYQRYAPNGYRAILPDQVLTPAAWQTELTHVPQAMQIEAPIDQGRYAASLLAIAHQQWQAGAQPHWAAVLPYYGQHPVSL